MLRRRLAHRPQLLKMLDNAGWLFIDRGVRIGVGLLVFAWLARYLGPEDFGKLSFALAFVALFQTLTVLGLNRIVVRDIARDPGCANRTLGTTLALQFLAAVLANGLIFGLIAWVRPDDAVTRSLVAIIGLGLLFQVREAVRYWFESQLQSRYTVWAENSVFLLAAGIKLLLIWAEAPLIAFAWAILAEMGFGATALFLTYARRTGQLRQWRVDWTVAKTLLSAGWPLLLTALALMVQHRIGQILLAEMAGDVALGQFAAAYRVIEVLNTVPMIISSTLAASIAQLSHADRPGYQARLRDLYRIMLLAFLGVALPILLLADWLIPLVFGRQYQQAAEYLPWLLMPLFFTFFGVARGLFITSENLFRHALISALSGATVNVLLNLALIPRFGAHGVIAAGTLSGFVTVFVMDALHSPGRPNLNAMLHALISPHRLGQVTSR